MSGLCDFTACDRPKRNSVQKLCDAHYTQRRQGKKMVPLRHQQFPIKVPWTADLILQEAVRSGDCLLFRPGRKRKYPQVKVGDKHPMAYRLVYEDKKGPLPHGVHVHHICADTRCVNPDHLQSADQADNNLEMLGRRSYEARISALEARVKELEAQLKAREESQ